MPNLWDSSGIVAHSFVSLGLWLEKTCFVKVILIEEAMSGAPTVSPVP